MVNGLFVSVWRKHASSWTLGVALLSSACTASGSGEVARVQAKVPSLLEPSPPAMLLREKSAPAAVPLAPPHPALMTLFAEPLAALDDRSRSRPVPLDEADCRVATGFQGPPIDRCELVLLANGTAPCVSVIYDCGAHLCESESFLWYGDQPAPRAIHGAALQTLELSPDHRYLVRSELVYSDEPQATPLPEGGRTIQEELDTGQLKTIASCLSTVLSPGNRYYVCRDLAGNVLRFPVTGGEVELLVPVKIPENERVKVGGPFSDYPQPVEFSTDNRMKFTLYLESETVLDREVPWNE